MLLERTCSTRTVTALLTMQRTWASWIGLQERRGAVLAATQLLPRSRRGVLAASGFIVPHFSHSWRFLLQVHSSTTWETPVAYRWGGGQLQ
jgi:hypothetical protein